MINGFNSCIKKVVGVTIFFFVQFFCFSQHQEKADSLIKSWKESNNTPFEQILTLKKITALVSSPDDRIVYSEKLLELSQLVQDKESIGYSFRSIGVAFREKGNLEKSLEYLFKSVKVYNSNGNYSELAKTYTEIGTTYTKNGDTKNSLLYKSKAIEVLRNMPDKQTLAITLLNTGYSNYQINSLDTALSYYNEAEPIFEEINLEIGKAYTIGNRALVYWKQGNSDQAIEDLKVAISMLEPLGDQFGMADYYNQLGKIYLERNDPVNALRNTEIGLEMAMAVDLKEQVRDASELLAQLYRDRGDYQKAYDFQSQYIAYKDSIQDQETTRRLADLRTAFEVGQKQAEIELVSAEKRTQQILSMGLGVILFLTGVFAIISYRNYTTKKKINTRLEEQAVILKEQKVELEKLNKTKDKFFAIVSHDLRGPITSFFGVSYLIKALVESKETDQLLDVAGDIDRSVRQLSDLLDNLLSWATQQQGQVPFKPGELDVSHMANRVKQNLQNVANSKHIELVVNVDESIKAYADRNTAETIVRNLVSNALKFTPEGGRVTIAAETQGKMVAISVRDTGVGISPEVMDSIFVLNDAQSTYGTDGERGIGLGLQLVKEFTDLNGGTLTLDSEVGKGTEFRFTLPMT